MPAPTDPAEKMLYYYKVMYRCMKFFGVITLFIWTLLAWYLSGYVAAWATGFGLFTTLATLYTMVETINRSIILQNRTG